MSFFVEKDVLQLCRNNTYKSVKMESSGFFLLNHNWQSWISNWSEVNRMAKSREITIFWKRVNIWWNKGVGQEVLGLRSLNKAKTFPIVGSKIGHVCWNFQQKVTIMQFQGGMDRILYNAQLNHNKILGGTFTEVGFATNMTLHYHNYSTLL